MKHNDPLYKKIEAILYNYNLNKAQIKSLNLEIEYMKNIYGDLNSISYKEKIKSTNKFSSIVENELIKKEDEIKKLENKKRLKEVEIEKVNIALSVLDDREKGIIEMRYFEKYSNIQIAAKLYLTEQHTTKIKSAAINKIAKLLLVEWGE